MRHLKHTHEWWFAIWTLLLMLIALAFLYPMS